MKEVAKERGVKFVQTMDGAKLLKNEIHTSMGVRLIDIKTKDPIVRLYLLKDGGQGLVQSQDWCIPIKLFLVLKPKL